MAGSVLDSPQLGNNRNLLNRLQTRNTNNSLLNTPTTEQNQETESMTTAGQFILLFSANIFLSGDFEYCLKISMNNFTCIENSSLFEANILRFRSLAADQVFHHKEFNSKNEEEKQSDLKYLFLAFQAATNALSIYQRAKGKQEGSAKTSNSYGQAL